MRTCKHSWDEFRRNAISPSAPKIQLDEMRLAFYVGFQNCLQITSDIATLSDEAAVQVLEGLHQEFRAFAAAIVMSNK